MEEITKLQEEIDGILSRMRQRSKAKLKSVDGYKLLRVGHLIVGSSIHGNKMWPFEAGQVIMNKIMTDDGVIIKYQDGIIRTINNNFIDGTGY